MKLHKHAFMLLVLNSLCILTYAQNSDQFKISLNNDSLSVNHDGKVLPIKSIRQLDDYLKEHAQSNKQMNVTVESVDTKRESTQAVNDVLEKYTFLSVVRRSLLKRS